MNIARTMKRLKEDLKRFAHSLKRIPAEKGRIKKEIAGAGVYLFFRDGILIRCGSSINAPSRVFYQCRDIYRFVARSVAKELGIEVNKKCGECGRESCETTKELVDLERKMRGRVSVSFVPLDLLERFGMGVRQFEGLLLWATRPPMNSAHEPEHIGRNNLMERSLNLG